jgi:hypothetical protein
MKEKIMSDEKSDNGQSFLIYQDDNGISNVTVRFEGEDVWLTAEQLQMLFQASRQDVAYHIKQIYEDRELTAEGTGKKFLLVRQEGTRVVRRQFPHYNLDMILAIGMRIRSEVAVRFSVHSVAFNLLIVTFTLFGDHLCLVGLFVIHVIGCSNVQCALRLRRDHENRWAEKSRVARLNRRQPLSA